MRAFVVISLFAALFVGAGCQSPTYPPGSSLGVLPSSAPAMPGVLTEGDLIQITFVNSTNLSTAQRIQLDGNISLQFVGNVKAAGKTPAELKADLEKLYASQIRGSDQITVAVVTSASVVYVTGAVLRPGKILLERPLTLLDAVNEAGGVDSTRAKLSEVTVLRVENGRRISRRFNLKHALQGKDTSLFYLKPFDTIYVPEKLLNL